ncbi:MAG: FtsX-like permease family protein [Anaerolineales bacterium]
MASFSPSLLKVGWRYLFSHPLQSALMLLGIALGVSVAVSVDVANASAARGFELSIEAVTGRSTHYISGGPPGLAEETYTELRNAGLGVPMAPIASQMITSPDLGDLTLQLLGVDPFAEEPFRSYLYTNEGGGSMAQMDAFFTVPGAVLISTDLAQQYSLQSGYSIDLNINGHVLPGLVVGLIDPQDELSRRALQNIVLADISTVQEFSGRLGIIERIDLILPVDGKDALIAQIETLLPASAVVLTAEGRNETVEDLTGAFQTNLAALSMLGLVVGLFLIYNTMTFSVVQRRQSFGTLRALGTTGREIFVLVLSEALLVGIVGSILGVGLGILFGRGAVELVTQTINDVFYAQTVRGVSIPASSFIKGGLLGLGTTIVAALLPAWEAAKSPPRRTLSRSQLETTLGKLLQRAALLGALMAAVSAFLLISADLNLPASFAGIFGLVIGFAITTPWITQQLMPLATHLLAPFGPLGRLAPREVSNSASRTSPAMAALMVAVAVTIGASLMVGSFRASVIDWLEIVLGNDIYISVAGSNLAEPMVAIAPEAIERIDNWPDVEAVHLLRIVQVDSPHGPITVSANDNPNDGDEQVFLDTEGTGHEVWEAVKAGAVIISEPLANRLDLGAGDSIVLYTNQGEQSFHIAAVFTDYSSSRGNITMWLDNYRQFWADDAVTALSVKVAQGADVDAMVEDMQTELNPIQFLLIRSNLALRTETLVVFDQSFLITNALQLITTAVAFVGVLSAMLSLQLEKQRQMGILKAIGLSQRQVWALTLLETGLIGAIAGLLALPTGYVVAQVLLRLINRLSFGWTLQMHLQAEPFVQAMIIAIGAALLAGLYPAYRATQRSAADAMRFD